jgi:hypothetical protein
MERFLVVVATALAPAPLLCMAGMALANAALGDSGGADRSIAVSYLALLAGIGTALVGAVPCGFLAARIGGGTQVRLLLLADAIVLVVGVVVWARLLAPAPALEYADRTPSLDVEVRVADSVLSGARVTDAVAVDFVGGSDLSLPHPESARSEDGYAILPWETTPLRVRAWEVRVILHNHPLLFRLGLPRRPSAATEWSDWIRPTPSEGFEMQEGIQLRYRFRLTAPGS